MGKLNTLCVHCTDTPASMTVSKAILEQWHKGPRDNAGGSVNYLGKKYNSRVDLPQETQGGIDIKKLKGRGWDRLGYSDLIHRNGAIENLTPYNEDNIVQANEMTWGASGINSNSRHIVLEGGWKSKGERAGIFNPYDIYTSEQLKALKSYIIKFKQQHPEAKVIGHNEVSGKTCPNFDVQSFLTKL